MIRKRILQLVVAFSTTALDKKVSFMLKVLEQLLTSLHVERPEYPAYNDAVKELQGDSVYELQRLATKMPDQLLVRNLHYSRRLVLTSNRTYTSSSRRKSTRSFPREPWTQRDRYPTKLSSSPSCKSPGFFRHCRRLNLAVSKPPKSNQMSG